MPSPVHHQQHRSTGAEGGLVPSCGLRRSIYAVVDHNTQNRPGMSSPRAGLIWSRDYMTGGRYGVRTFPILTRLRVLLPRRAARPVQWPSLLCIGRPLLEPLSNHAVSLLGAGVMDSSICHPRCTLLPLLRRGSRLRKQPAKFIFRRARHLCQDLIEPLHYHRLSLSSALVASDRKHAVKGFGRVPSPYRALNKSEGELPNVGR